MFGCRFVVSPASEVSTDAGEEEANHNQENNMPVVEENLPTPVAENAASLMEETAPPTVCSTPVDSKQLSSGIAKSVSKKSRDWLGTEGETLGHHLTIGPHGVDWARKLGLDPARKGSEPEMGSASGGDLRRSTDCIAHKDLAASSDSDLLRSAPPWVAAHTRSKFRFSPEKEASSDSSRTVSSQEGDDTTHSTFPGAAAAAAAKKTRVKQSLMKRARSVAIFSLKLKERRAREASVKEAETKAKEKWMPPANVGGELSCIPIEKLISVDDVAMDLQHRMNPSGNF